MTARSLRQMGMTALAILLAARTGILAGLMLAALLAHAGSFKANAAATGGGNRSGIACLGDSNSINHGDPESFCERWRDITNTTIITDIAAVGGTESTAAAGQWNGVKNGAPLYVTLAFGTNDATNHRVAATVAANIQSAVDTMRAAGARVVLLNVPPQKTYSGCDASCVTTVVSINALLPSTGGLRCFVDQNALLDANADGVMDAQYDSGDHLHTNNAGKLAIANLIYRTCGPA